MALSGQSLVQHHMDFVHKSGVPERGGIAREHHSLTEMLRLLTAHDQLDVSMIAGAELAVRRLYALETAVARKRAMRSRRSCRSATSLLC